MVRIEACYNKCIKSFFNYRRLDSVTFMPSELGLPNFRTLCNDCLHKFNKRCLKSVNGAVRHFIDRVPYVQFVVYLFISI